MANDQELVGNVREVLAATGDISEVRMFGGTTFLLRGNMLCCASAKGLMVRVGVNAEAGALKSPYARPCLGTGRRMAGFLMIDPGGTGTDKHLREWIALARRYVETLPPKVKGKTKHRKGKSK